MRKEGEKGAGGGELGCWAVGKLCWSWEVIREEQSTWEEGSVPAESVRMEGLALRLVLCQT